MLYPFEGLSEVEVPEYFNIGAACTDEPTKQGFGSTLAVIVEDQTGAVHQLSYAELSKLSDVAASLLSRKGVKKGDRIVLLLPNCIEFPVWFFAALKLGCIAVPLSTMLTSSEISYVMEDANPLLVISDQMLFAEHQRVFNENGSVLVDDAMCSLKALSSAVVDDQAIEATLANDPAYLVYTSGTTGHPKGVLHAHRSLLGRLPAAIDWFHYQEGERVLHTGKFNWTYVLGTGLMDPLLQGKTVVLYGGENAPEKWPELIKKHACTTFISVPAIYRQILQKTTTSIDDLPSLRHCMSAGEHLPTPIIEQWRQRFGQDVYEAVGMSECSYYLSQHPTRSVKAGSAGRVQRGHQVKLIDENGVEVKEVGREARLAISRQDPGLFIEYWGKPDETQESREGDFFITGDYAYRDEEGDIWFLGRKDDILNSFGYRVSPHEIERVMKSVSGLEECVACTEDLGSDKSIIVLLVVAKTSQVESLKEVLMAHAQNHLAAYKRPREIYFMERFPKTANGKIQRKLIRAQSGVWKNGTL